MSANDERDPSTKRHDRPQRGLAPHSAGSIRNFAVLAVALALFSLSCGGTRPVKVNVRVIAATNRDLEAMTKDGTFRTDLFYRLNVFPLEVPPLRERGKDVVLLAETFARKFGRERGVTTAPFTDACKAKLMAYDWPGNVRELQNVIERALITSTDGRRLNLDRALPEAMPCGEDRSRAAQGAAPDKEDRVLNVDEMRELERANLHRALVEADWKISGADGAAERLGLKPNTLSSGMMARGVRRP